MMDVCQYFKIAERNFNSGRWKTFIKNEYDDNTPIRIKPAVHTWEELSGRRQPVWIILHDLYDRFKLQEEKLARLTQEHEEKRALALERSPDFQPTIEDRVRSIREAIQQDQEIERRRQEALRLKRIKNKAKQLKLRWLFIVERKKKKEETAELRRVRGMIGPPWKCPVCGEWNDYSWSQCFPCNMDKSL